MDKIQVNNHIYNKVNMEQVLDVILNSKEFQDDINEIYYTRHAYRRSTLLSTLNEHRSLNNDSNIDHKEKNIKDNTTTNSKSESSGNKKEIQFNSSSKTKLMKTNLPSSFLKNILNFEPSHKPLKNDVIYRIINRWINSNTTVI
eukprot:jgi/Orpsp1_1/1176351/evm.model.c7180000057290.1